MKPKPGAPHWIGLSPTIWLLLGGGVVIWLFVIGEPAARAGPRAARGSGDAADTGLARRADPFFFQFFLQGGLFFAVPLFLSVALGLSAIATGVRLLPLSITLILAAAGVPKLFPHASPRRVVRIGFIALFAGIVVMVVLLTRLDLRSPPADAPRWPWGRRARLAARKRHRVRGPGRAERRGRRPAEHDHEPRHSIGTALTGAIIIAALTTSFLNGIQNNPDIPNSVKTQATTQLAGGAPFISDAQLKTALNDAHVPPKTADAIVQENATARIDGLRTALSVLAIFALIALFFSGGDPDTPARVNGASVSPLRSLRRAAS